MNGKHIYNKQGDLSRLLGMLNTHSLGNYREVFNAWNHTESRTFIYLKTLADRLRKAFKVSTPEPLLLQLIPIESDKQNDELVYFEREHVDTPKKP